MGKLLSIDPFGIIKKVVGAPKPPPLPAAPPAPESVDPQAVMARNSLRKKLAAANGPASTVLTSPAGAGQPTTQSKSLLGL